MDKIFEQAKDLHVVATYVYVNGDTYAYEDKECTKKIKKSVLKDLFLKGMLVNDEGTLKTVLAFTNGVVVYVDSIEDGVSTAMLNGEADDAE